MNKNCITNWLPKLIKSGVKVPYTEIVPTNGIKFLSLLDGITPDGYDDYIEELLGVARGIVERCGLPLFMKTNLLAGKHSWKDTCYIDDLNAIPQHIFNLVEESAMAHIMGMDIDGFVLREFLPTYPSFYAFWGNLPICKERRYFFGGGEVIKNIPYWPVEAIDGYANDPQWREKLQDISIQSPDEVSILSNRTKVVSEQFDPSENWSLDWMCTDRGWYAIDMAIAEESWGWENE